MVLKIEEIVAIFSRRQLKTKRVLTWKGWRHVKIIDKPAVLHDIWNVLSRELNEQRQYLEAEVSNMRQHIEAEQEKKAAELIDSAPGYVFEELRVLFRELEKELEGQLTNLPGGKSSVLERIWSVLGQNFDGQLREVDRMEKDSTEQMEELRRRLVRMAKDLHLSQEEVADLREALAAAYDGGVASIYKSVQGLLINDTNVEKKRELLKKIFEQNLDIRNTQPDDG
jgi:hypothetical protein